eukprot:jgi/Tetstr1/442032/TSEL_030213.t1
MAAAKEMRHWNPEAHIGDDGYVLLDVKAAVAEATAGTTGEQEMRRRGANAPRPAQRGANSPRPAQRGANAPRPAQRGANAPRPAQRGANAPRPAQRGANAPTRGDRRMLGHIFSWRCRISGSPTRISAYGGKSSSLSPIKLRKKHSKKRAFGCRWWESQGHIFPWRCRISASPTRISAYGGKSSSL